MQKHVLEYTECVPNLVRGAIGAKIEDGRTGPVGVPVVHDDDHRLRLAGSNQVIENELRSTLARPSRTWRREIRTAMGAEL